jgi:hypothetical protein
MIRAIESALAAPADAAAAARLAAAMSWERVFAQELADLERLRR